MCIIKFEGSRRENTEGKTERDSDIEMIEWTVVDSLSTLASLDTYAYLIASKTRKTCTFLHICFIEGEIIIMTNRRYDTVNLT